MCLRRPNTNRVIDEVLNGAQILLDTGGDALNFCPVPGLPAAANVMSSLIDMVIQMRGNEQSRRDLAEYMRTLASNIKTAIDTANNASSRFGASIRSPELDDRVNQLIQRLQRLVSDTEELGEQSCLKKFLHGKDNAGILTRLKEGVREANEIFFMQGQIFIETLLYRVVEQLAEQELNYLAHANAGYSPNSIPTSSGVLEGTRDGLLTEIMQWANGPDPNSEENDPLIYVLSGGAGTGKSTIAYEVAERLHQSGALGASFFFVTGVDRLDSTRHVALTIAYQLAHLQTDIRKHITGAAAYRKMGKQGKKLKFEVEELLINPLKNVPPTHRRLVIVTDALDECQGEESAQDDVVQLLYLLMQRIPKLPFQLRIFLLQDSRCISNKLLTPSISATYPNPSKCRTYQRLRQISGCIWKQNSPHSWRKIKIYGLHAHHLSMISLGMLLAFSSMLL